jgi:hypothetical protein
MLLSDRVTSEGRLMRLRASELLMEASALLKKASELLKEGF